MEAMAALLLFLVVTVSLAIGRVAGGIFDTAVSSLSGELGSLMPRGWLGRGTRIGRIVDLQAVVSSLALITRMNLPLCSALEAAAQGASRRVRRILEELSRTLRTGVSVSRALEAAFPGCPPQLADALQKAEECGQLRRALADEERMISATIDTHRNRIAHARHAVLYGALMVLVAGGMVSWVMIFLLPKYKDIFNDYDAQLPGVTIALVSASDWFFMHTVAILVGLVLVLLSILVVSLAAGRMNESSPFTRTVAWVRWMFPITRTLDYGLGMAKVIRWIALGVRSGAANAFPNTLPTAVSATNGLRRNLSRFVRSIADGATPHQAAKEAQLGDVLVCALRMVEHGEDAERALTHAADYYEAIAYRWWHTLVAVTGPLVTLVCGVMVGFIALSLFLPLIALIDAVSGTL